MKKKQPAQKCILSVRIARDLMRRGFLPIDVEDGRKVKCGLVFIFRNTPELNAALDEIMGGAI